VLSLTYMASERAIPGYGGGMSSAKAALESDTRTLAFEAGRRWGVRVNAISAGPVRTLAAAGISGFKKLYGSFAEVAPLRRNVSIEDVGSTAVYLASDLSAGVTGEILYVDSGFSHVVGGIAATSSPSDSPA
jgi:enoyl-[acyl-carrier protein] reductase I